MGNQCCSGRDSLYKAKSIEVEWGKVVNPLYDFLFATGEDDVARFDRAYDSNDIEEFVKLCNSNCEIQNLPQHIHPWAEDPKTVSALAATQLAILASKETQPEFKDQIREFGGINALVDLLKSKEKDRLHAAVVALSFLSDTNPQNCIKIQEVGAMSPLVEGMKSEVDGMRAACAQTARNIYVLDIKYRKEFLSCGGLENLIKFLDLPEESDSQPLYTQFEAIYHLEDFILDNNVEIPALVKEVKAAGALEKVKALEKVNDQGLAEAANLLAIRLEAA